jgi:hypothetical protein
MENCNLQNDWKGIIAHDMLEQMNFYNEYRGMISQQIKVKRPPFKTLLCLCSQPELSNVCPRNTLPSTELLFTRKHPKAQTYLPFLCKQTKELGVSNKSNDLSHDVLRGLLLIAPLV